MREICKEQVAEYIGYLRQEEKSASTCEQYRRDILNFLIYAEGGITINKETVIGYKELLRQQFQPATVNVKLAAINGFFSFLGRNDLKVKRLTIQHKPYCAKEKELTKEEYRRLVRAAERQENEKLALLIQTICGTDIRVSELQYVTVEAVCQGEANIELKGKHRTILISGKLKKLLVAYLKRHKIKSGPVFVTRSGKPLNRSNIWKQMKALCESAGVDTGKVFPHNLRHLFARCFYSADKDIAKLADILGHSSIDTTRVYIISSGQEHRRRIEALGLVV